MGIEIRAAREEELAKVHDVVALSFNGDRTEQGRQGFMHVEKMAHPTALLDDGEIVASLRVYDFVTLVNGSEVAMGGVSSVSCYPEHRRKGHVGRLLADALGKMRDKGQALSALYTPHPGLYRKFGYMTAGINVKYTWAPKQLKPYAPFRPKGRAVRVGEDEWKLLEDVFERFSLGRTGPIRRTETWWREGVFRHIYDPERKLKDAAVWYGGSGKAEGYVTYRNDRSGGGSGTLGIGEFTTLTADAYLGLLRYVLSHDLNDGVTWFGPVDDPLALAVADPAPLKRELVDDYMLRVVDVGKAVAARSAGKGARDGSVSVAIEDEVCPWNRGTWRIENEGGRLSAKQTADGPDVAMEAATFAAVYNGFLRCSDAARSGLATALNDGATEMLDNVFASEYVPNCSDFF